MIDSARMTTGPRPQGASRARVKSEPVAGLLATLAASDRVAVLEQIAAGETDAVLIARATDLPEDEVVGHIEALSAAGIINDPEHPDSAQLAYHAVRLLDTAVSPPAAPAESRNGPENGDLVPVVPQPPLACTVCDNSVFVSDVLGSLRATLGEAKEYHRQIQDMSSQVLTAHEAERKRIARELHDDTAQALTSMLVRLRLLERSSLDTEVLANVEELRELTAAALDSVRRMATDLRPAALDDLGLVPAMKAYGERFTRNWGIDVTIETKGVTRRLPPETELVLYRVFQEALTNIAKHSGAGRVRVALARRRNQVVLSIEDNGRGFAATDRARPEGTGMGLFGMRERLALVNGTLETNSNKGGGATIVARVPLAQTQKSGDGER
jgi:signal transduction histidine kinase